MKSKTLFSIGEKVFFTYKRKAYSGFVKRINKVTITVDTDIGQFRGSPSRFSYDLNNSDAPSSQTRWKNKRIWNTNQIADYEKSNAALIEKIPQPELNLVHIIIKRLAEGLIGGNDSKIKEHTNQVMIFLSEHYRIPIVVVHTKGKRINGNRMQIYGIHRTRDLGNEKQRSSISVFSRTTKTLQYVKPKTFLRTLVHEFIHHYDRYKLNLTHEYHTKGYYRRLSTLYNQMKVVLD
ncbi:MAG: hypothetical protein ACXAC8_16300 [Candidatus Hodarchaeales archaeon]|jgi:hypothetical protein